MPKKLTREQEIEASLNMAQEYCDLEDKSTEFMIAFMIDNLVDNFQMTQDEAHAQTMAYLGT